MVSGWVNNFLPALLPPLAPSHHHQVGSDGSKGSEGAEKMEIPVSRAVEEVEMDNEEVCPRLEYLCASKIMSGVETAARFLPHAPPTLIPSLFKALLTAAYSQNAVGPSSSLSLLPLSELLLWWPSSTFSLISNLPFLTSPTYLGAEKQMEKLSAFMASVVTNLLHVYLNKLRDPEWRERCAVSRLDLSGAFQSKLHPRRVVITEQLVEHVRHHYNPNAPPDYDQREVVVDLTVSEKRHVQDVCVLCEVSGHHGAGLRVKLGQVEVTGVVEDDITTICHALRQSDVHSIEVERCTPKDITCLLSLPQSLRGISLAMTLVSDLSFLTHFQHLRQLALAGIRLGGRCEVLENLKEGLQYLNLSGCSLHAPDLTTLAASHHTSSLVQLDLSYNNFGGDLGIRGLCHLCHHLPKVTILEIDSCYLDRESPSLMTELVMAISSLPSLVLLHLSSNNISSPAILQAMPFLGACLTLRCVGVTVPSDAYISDDYNVTEETIKTLKDTVDRRLREVRSPPPVVDWFENSSYSHWYYAVQPDEEHR